MASLYTVTNGQQSNASDLNQLIQELQRQTGSQEVGKYFTVMWANGSGDYGGLWVSMRNRVTQPVSNGITIDTTTSLDTNLNSPTVAHQDASGFQIYSSSKASSANLGFGGNWTANF